MKTLLAAALLSLAMTACASESNDDIAVISIYGLACADCSDGISIGRDGRFLDTTTQHGFAAVDTIAAKRLIASFPLAEFRVAELPQLTTPASVGMLDVAYADGRRQRSPVVLDGNVEYVQGRRLRRWTEDAAFTATGETLHGRRIAIDRALASHTLRSVTVESLGCYGACAQYVATFGADGRATLHSRGPGCEGNARARVAFERILAAVGPQLRWLRPAYPTRTQDTLATRITVTTSQATFVSEAGDSTAWGAPFAAAETRLDQLVQDTTWIATRARQRCSTPLHRYRISTQTGA